MSHKYHKQYVPSVLEFMKAPKGAQSINEAKKGKGGGDISGENSIAKAVHPVLTDAFGVLADPRKGKDQELLNKYKMELIDVLNDEKVSASPQARSKWIDVVNSAKSLTNLTRSMTNLYLAGSDLRLDRGKM